MKALLTIILFNTWLLVSGQDMGLNGRIENFSPDNRPLINDTVPLVEYAKMVEEGNQPVHFINDRAFDASIVKTLDLNLIDSIHIDKTDIEIDGKKYRGQLHLKMKDGYRPKLITLSELKAKYTQQLDKPTLFMIDNEIIKDDYDKFLVDLNYLLKMVADSVVLCEENLNIAVVKLITKKEENIKAAENIKIRGLTEAE